MPDKMQTCGSGATMRQVTHDSDVDDSKIAPVADQSACSSRRFGLAGGRRCFMERGLGFRVGVLYTALDS